MKFEGKVAVVTGGGGGMGMGISKELSQEGADVAVFDVKLDNAEKTARLVRESGRKAMAIECDVARFLDVNSAIGKVYKEFKHIDILVNTAGYGQYVPVSEMTEEMWDRMIAVHLKGTFNCSRAVINGMISQRSGRIISISSVTGLGGAATHAHYAAAKAGIIGFSKSLAKEVADRGITVNVVAPGIVETGYFANMPPERAQKMKESALTRTLVGRIGTPKDIAAPVAFLASDDASYITGQVISPNGGLYM